MKYELSSLTWASGLVLNGAWAHSFWLVVVQKFKRKAQGHCIHIKPQNIFQNILRKSQSRIKFHIKSKMGGMLF
jgi:hypothetical protein